MLLQGRWSLEKPPILTNISSHHHLAQKFSALSTLVHRVRSIADTEYVDEELKTLWQVFIQHCYSLTEVDWMLTQNRKLTQVWRDTEEELIRGVAVVPSCSTTTNRLTRLLKRQNVKVVAKPPLKIKHLIRPVKDSLGLNTQESIAFHAHVVSLILAKWGWQ